MTIEFLEDYGKWKTGDVLKDVWRSDALELIVKGIAVEIPKPEPPKFQKYDWGKTKKKAEEVTKPLKSK